MLLPSMWMNIRTLSSHLTSLSHSHCLYVSRTRARALSLSVSRALSLFLSLRRSNLPHRPLKRAAYATVAAPSDSPLPTQFRLQVAFSASSTPCVPMQTTLPPPLPGILAHPRQRHRQNVKYSWRGCRCGAGGSSRTMTCRRESSGREQDCKYLYTWDRDRIRDT